MQNKLILRNEHSPYNDITQGSVLSTNQLDGNLIFLKGLAISEATSTNSTISLKRINGDIIEINYSGNSSSSGTTIDQNNIFIKSNYNVYNFEGNSLAGSINDAPTFTVGEKEIYVFDVNYFFRGISTALYKRIYVLKLGKGTYGVGGTQITLNDLILLSDKQISQTQIIEDPTTQIIDFGEIANGFSVTIDQYLNSQSPSITLQNQSEGYVVIKTLINGVVNDYLFLGVGGLYGFSDLQTTMSDFQLLSDITNIDGFYHTVTKAEIDTLINNNSLIKGATYKIIDVDINLYGGTEIYLTALENNKLSTTGSGKFFTPKYSNSSKIWSKYFEPTFSNVGGQFIINETVVGGNGAAAKYLCEGFLEFISGDWSVESTLLGSTSNASADISTINNPNYNINDIVHWGGKSWVNLNGNLGDSIDQFTLNNEWEVIPFNEIDYNLSIDEIKYDYNGDVIIYRKDKLNNEINNFSGIAIKKFKWGDYASRTSNNILNESELECINFLGTIQGNNLFGSGIYNIISNNNSYFLYNSMEYNNFGDNILYNSSISQNKFTNGNITGNMFNSPVSLNNFIIASVNSNSFINTPTINNNFNDGNLLNNYFKNSNFANNTVTHSFIFLNNVNDSQIIDNELLIGSITSNSLSNTSVIRENHLKGDSSNIENNILSTSLIYENELYNGSHLIDSNLTDSQINNNTLHGSILKIESLTNNTNITNNVIKNCGLNIGGNYDNKILSNIDIKKVEINGLDLSTANLIFSQTDLSIFTRPDGAIRVKYYDDTDTMIITDLTA